MRPSNAVTCDDGNVCTTDVNCFSGTCLGFSIPGDDDGDPRTVESCDPASGCIRSPLLCADEGDRNHQDHDSGNADGRSDRRGRDDERSAPRGRNHGQRDRRAG